MSPTSRKVTILVILIAAFVLFDIGIFNVFTVRCLKSYGEGMQAKSVELADYLPFDEGTQAVTVKSDFQMKGELPVIDGAAGLYPVFAGFVGSVYPEDSVSFDGRDYAKASKLQMRNTRAAYKAIVDGSADIVICAKPSQEQLAYAKKQGVELEFTPIGKDAFVFVVNKKNPVKDLSVEQVQGIYAGNYTNWSQVGGDHSPIASLTRNEGSGSQTAMVSFMGEKKIKKHRNTFLGRAIGYSFRFYVSDVVKDGEIKMISLNGIEPTEENIRSGAYPVTGEFYAVTRKDETNHNVAAMVKWMLSEEGQKIVEDTGYVSMN